MKELIVMSSWREITIEKITKVQTIRVLLLLLFRDLIPRNIRQDIIFTITIFNTLLVIPPHLIDFINNKRPSYQGRDLLPRSIVMHPLLLLVLLLSQALLLSALVVCKWTAKLHLSRDLSHSEEHLLQRLWLLLLLHLGTHTRALLLRIYMFPLFLLSLLPPRLRPPQIQLAPQLRQLDFLIPPPMFISVYVLNFNNPLRLIHQW